MNHPGKSKRWRARHPEQHRAQQQRAYHSLKTDPVRWARYKEYHRVYQQRWEAQRRKEHVWNEVEHSNARMGVFTEPFPRFEEVGLSSLLSSTAEA
jgi:hypothetical protein